MKKLFTDWNLVLFGLGGFALAMIDLLVFQKPFVCYKPYWPQFGILGVIGRMMIGVLCWFFITRFVVAPVIILRKKRKRHAN